MITTKKTFSFILIINYIVYTLYALFRLTVLPFVVFVLFKNNSDAYATSMGNFFLGVHTYVDISSIAFLIFAIIALFFYFKNKKKSLIHTSILCFSLFVIRMILFSL